MLSRFYCCFFEFKRVVDRWGGIVMVRLRYKFELFMVYECGVCLFV